MIVAAVTWAGTLPAWLTFLGVIGAAFALRSGQLGPAIGYMRDANAALERENVELKKQVAELTATVGSLKARTDLAPLQAALVLRMDKHEERAQDRHDKTMILMELIAERLGPENGESRG